MLRTMYGHVMRKETGIAIFLGILAGVSIGAIVLWQTKQAQQSSSQVLQGSITPTITSAGQEITPLLITTPETESIVTSDTVTLKGSAPKDSLLVIQSETGESVEKSVSGSFETEIELIEGQNTLRLTSYAGKTIDSRTVIVYFVPEQ